LIDFFTELIDLNAPFAGLPTFVICALLAESPALKVLKLDHVFAAASRAKFKETRLSSIDAPS
jgi:hypothetical protein